MNEGEEIKYQGQEDMQKQVETGKTSPFQRAARLPEVSRLHGQPTLWWRSLAGEMSLRDRRGWAQQSTFHRVALNEVRKVLGKKNCKHLIHVQDGSGISFRAKVNIKGSWKTINVETERKKAAELTPEDYKSLKDVLGNAIGS